MTISLRVRKYRKLKGWTQAQLSKRARVREATISDYENGKVTRVDLITLESIAVALGINAALLIEHKGKRSGRGG